jgi:hypothetical protein
MTRCDYCGSTILLGGTEQGSMRFCNTQCASQAPFVIASRSIPPDQVIQQAQSIHMAPCPACGGKGPVDVHTTYRVWSALIVTSWASRPEVSCRTCANKRRAGDLLMSLLVGWWGFPWGLIMTPIQITRNLIGFFKAPDPSRPSEALRRLVRIRLAANAAASQAR